MTFLGINIGTLAVKAVLIDADDTVRANAAVPIATDYPEPGYAEQDPDEWWRATMAAIDEVRAADPDGFAAMRGIGLSGQMHAAVVLDENDCVIRPAITWNDARATRECEVLEKLVPDLEEIVGASAMPSFTAPKLLWLRETEPHNFERIARVMAAKDYVRLKLTGEFATDHSDAAGMLLLDEASREWSGAMVEASGLHAGMLPELLEGPGWSGMVLRPLLAEWGIEHQVVVAAGAGDIVAAAIGAGAIRDGHGVLSLGAAAQVFVARDAYGPGPGPGLRDSVNTFAHSLAGRWFETATLFNGTLCLDWLTGMLGERDVGRLVARAQERFDGPSPLMFLPYLAGERAPFNDPDARGAFTGIDEESGQREMTQAVLEGIALSLKEAEDAFGGSFPAGAMPIVGEGSRSALWLLIAASILDRPLLRLSNADIAAAFGAARLGRMAATGEDAETVCVQPPLIEIVDPVPDLRAAYAEQRPDFRAFAASIREVRKPRAAKVGSRRRASR